ncbi:MAG: hypothetical protein K2K06_08890 [Oscillospiraceae bacterium]|nr:hypothetical protein [Ruminococcus sp.]MDE6708133.1 hypothetical protein [Oscillospiraceae bacterium]
MQLNKITGEFASEELAELAGGRIRRTIRNIRSLSIRKLGKAIPSMQGKQKYTMLPANLRMENYITDVMISDLSNSMFPEYYYKKNAELTVICDSDCVSSVSAIMQSLGAINMKQT